MSQLLKAETAEREVRSVSYQLKIARFPAYRDLAGFDFTSSEINEALVRQLHRCEFMDVADNIVLVGGAGRQDPHGHHTGRPGYRTSPQTGAVLLDGRAGQRAGTGEGTG